jgi:putative glutamine amidotransferase
MYKIGITAGFMYPDLSRVVYGGKSLVYVERDMMRFVSKKGIIPVIIPSLEDEILFDLLKEMDGFILTGGTDIAPECYGEEPILDGRWKGDIFRDVYELKILKYAIEHDKPILGMCRGLQLLNVYMGGTLHQDTCTQKKDALVHRDAQIYDDLTHSIAFTKGKMMDRLYGHVTNPIVNSVHHQSIKDLGKDLDVLAYCPEDGIVEAIMYNKAPEGKVVAVQWHPEFTESQKVPIVDTRNLFDIFLKYVDEESKKRI